MNKKEFIEKLIDIRGCDAKPRSWARGWDDAIDNVIRIAEELDEPKEPVIPKFVIKRGLEAGGVSVEELNRIINAKAHGYDEVPIVADKTERVHVVKDGTKITVGETTSISFEEVMALVENKAETDTTHTNTNKDMVNQPNHYIGEYGLEVEDVLRNFIPRYTDPYVGHRIASAIEYLLRSPLKNGQQDIEKARKNLEQALAYSDMKDELK